ncbi:hypothetical protein LEMLEM_LOCUS7209 [Lemmus lemmus]
MPQIPNRKKEISSARMWPAPSLLRPFQRRHPQISRKQS